jgi:hypothetical protein
MSRPVVPPLRVVRPRANAGGDTAGALVDAHVLEAGGVVG